MILLPVLRLESRRLVEVGPHLVEVAQHDVEVT